MYAGATMRKPGNTKHKKLSTLEKKMLRAEKRKFEDQKKQCLKYFCIFPQGNLQERTENFYVDLC